MGLNLHPNRFLQRQSHIYDEDYVKWLMANHPNDVLSEWLTEVSTFSMVPATTIASQPDKSTESDKIVFKLRKRSQIHNSKPGGSEDTDNYTSKYLHQAILLLLSMDLYSARHQDLPKF